ncbi:MAG: hypothetical protein R3B09_00360 [Nannocystaceae bacterium]
MIGAPDAGKSNFLFRLWLAVEGGCGSLIRDGLPSDIEYLRTGAERLLGGEFAGRTSKEVQERVAIPIRSPDTCSQRGVLVVPDVPGEQVLAVYQDRAWGTMWEDAVSSGSSCLMFLRAGSEEIVAPLDWITCFAKLGAPVSRPEECGHGEEPQKVPTQVVMVEWLQFLRRGYRATIGSQFRPRIGIVISAWDAVPCEQQSECPEAYLRENFPMLYQYVKANESDYEVAIFGLSIVAGDLKNDAEFREAYLDGTPHESGYVVYFDGQLNVTTDISLPVTWALGISRGESGGRARARQS